MAETSSLSCVAMCVVVLLMQADSLFNVVGYPTALPTALWYRTDNAPSMHGNRRRPRCCHSSRLRAWACRGPTPWEYFAGVNETDKNRTCHPPPRRISHTKNLRVHCPLCVLRAKTTTQLNSPTVAPLAQKDAFNKLPADDRDTHTHTKPTRILTKNVARTNKTKTWLQLAKRAPQVCTPYIHSTIPCRTNRPTQTGFAIIFHVFANATDCKQYGTWQMSKRLMSCCAQILCK